MIIRPATKIDIPFIVDAIINIERTGNTDTFSNLFGTDEVTTRYYLEQFLLDDESLNTEFSLNTYSIVEIDGENAGCCCLFYTDSEYYQNKSELFPIHLKKEHLQKFVENAKALPDTKQYSTHKYFLEYLYVDDKFRGKGVSKVILEYLFAKTDVLYLIPLVNNTFAIDYYRRFGFVEDENIKTFPIDTLENKIYPGTHKIMLYKRNEKVN
ncbi:MULTISPECIES: GNAT family N-acetyltransferase [Chryseobacterium]|uniref:GNAT superfamily N-acetyltransferase n=1 Tax=Chryseobacterium geocarposphaerae TaxID=1416776 RepID=A0ABU1LF95_9FLAO|nr:MULTISPECIES: GNAT family N-acetyltransferase [Chryseobacterium]MDR6405369.1 GNAT superfamily N-acetyltransferase [Chryseobacterium geocarposphaerae]MDR6697528.1 GNAT superfamily N-acetyltransferase [Chryseobacterium ginsenosidimutans]